MTFPLEGVRVCDLTRYMAGGGATRLLAGLGCEVIRIEWKQTLPMTRFNGPFMPVGEMRERLRRGERIDKLMKMDGTPNQAGGFNENNAGKRGASLNIPTTDGLRILKEIISISDVVVENMRATVMEKWGIGYQEMRKIKPDIIYYQQSGFGRQGLYSEYVSTGPVAQTLAGLTEMSGLPEPYPPAGWGMSYMDWNGAYCGAMAISSALFHKARTGKGQDIDGSQAELGIDMTGTAILDYTVNGRRYHRTGNTSPYKPSAPHGIYRCQGPSTGSGQGDRWIAIAVYNDEEWQALCEVAGRPDWTRDPRFASLESRVQHQDDLNKRVEGFTKEWDPHVLMERLQKAGVRAGVCQTTEDRCDRDPQLKHYHFMVDLPTRDYGSWPVKDFPIKLSATPAYQGSIINRATPAYAEDNAWVYGELLGRSPEQVKDLEAANII